MCMSCFFSLDFYRSWSKLFIWSASQQTKERSRKRCRHIRYKETLSPFVIKISSSAVRFILFLNCAIMYLYLLRNSCYCMIYAKFNQILWKLLILIWLFIVGEFACSREKFGSSGVPLILNWIVKNVWTQSWCKLKIFTQIDLSGNINISTGRRCCLLLLFSLTLS